MPVVSFNQALPLQGEFYSPLLRIYVLLDVTHPIDDVTCGHKLEVGGTHRVQRAAACSRSRNHRIIEWFRLGGMFAGHLVQPLYHEQGHLQLDQVAQSPVQPDPQYFQGWGISHLSGQPKARFSPPQRKNFFLISSLNLPSFSLKPIPPCPVERQGLVFLGMGKQRPALQFYRRSFQKLGQMKPALMRKMCGGQAVSV